MADTEVKKILTKEEIRAKVEELVKDYNEAYQTGELKNAAKTEADIVEYVNQYTALARKECFERLAKSADPMLEAIKELTFPTIRARDTRQGEEKIPVRVVEDIDRPIDILKLHKEVKEAGGDGIGADKNWNYMIEKLNFLLTAQKCKDLGVDPKSVNDSYAMNAISREIDLGKNPTSKTNILKTLTQVVQAMIGDEYKPVSHDVNYLLTIYAKKNRQALSVTCATHRYMRNYIAEICHRIVTGRGYDVQFKKSNN